MSARPSPVAAGRRSVPIRSSLDWGRDVQRLRSEFDRTHCVRLPRLASGAGLDRVRAELRRAEFEVIEHPGGVKTELCLLTGRAVGLLALLANDPALFELVRSIAGCYRIDAFVGRVYRMLPGPAHEDSWHDDLKGGRMVAMSVNLSESAYEGGILEIRDRRTEERLAAIENVGPGDAVLFRLSPRLQHRVTAVSGDRPKTAFAGWFVGGGSPLARLASPRPIEGDPVG